MCNRSNDCFITAVEETAGWKAGHSVAFCVPCSKENNNISVDELQSVLMWQNPPHPAKLQPPSFPCSARSCLTLEKRVEIIKFAEKNPNLGYRKIAPTFGVGRMQIQSIMKKKDEILALYHSNLSKGQKQKREGCGKFGDVNQSLWDWYTLCRSSNIPVSGAMLQEEPMIIADKLGINGFTASNVWLESLKIREI